MEHGLIANASGALLTVLLLRAAWKLRIDRSFGTWLRRAGRPIGLDLTAAPVKVLAAVTLLAAYGSTAVSVVGVGETGFLVRFGRVVSTWEAPGAHVHAPWPFARLLTVDTARVHGLDFGFDRNATLEDSIEALALRAAAEEVERLQAEAQVITGEGTLLSLSFTTHFRVRDARAWRFGHERPELLVAALSESAIRRATGRRSTDLILTGDRVDLESEARADLQLHLNELDTGVDVVSVQLLDVHAPPEVHKAFRDVASAQEDAHREREVARRFEIETLAETRARVAEMLDQERAERARTLARARGEAAGVIALGAVHEARPGPIELVLWLEALERSLTGSRLILLLDPAIQVITTQRTRDASGSPAPTDIFDDSRR